MIHIKELGQGLFNINGRNVNIEHIDTFPETWQKALNYFTSKTEVNSITDLETAQEFYRKLLPNITPEQDRELLRYTYRISKLTNDGKIHKIRHYATKQKTNKR